MSYITSETDLITEYSDGSVDVRFTDAELAAMAADPVKFGYALRCGHLLSPTDAQALHEGYDVTCSICEAAYDAALAEEEWNALSQAERDAITAEVEAAVALEARRIAEAEAAYASGELPF